MTKKLKNKKLKLFILCRSLGKISVTYLTKQFLVSSQKPTYHLNFYL